MPITLVFKDAEILFPEAITGKFGPCKTCGIQEGCADHVDPTKPIVFILKHACQSYCAAIKKGRYKAWSYVKLIQEITTVEASNAVFNESLLKLIADKQSGKLRVHLGPQIALQVTEKKARELTHASYFFCPYDHFVRMKKCR